MVCPVCVVDGIVIASCRFFGLPDVVTAVFLGVLLSQFANITLRYLKEKLLLDKTIKGSLMFILGVYIVLTLLAMRLVGMF